MKVTGTAIEEYASNELADIGNSSFKMEIVAHTENADHENAGNLKGG